VVYVECCLLKQGRVIAAEIYNFVYSKTAELDCGYYTVL